MWNSIPNMPELILILRGESNGVLFVQDFFAQLLINLTLNNMKQGRKTASEKRKEAAKPRNHPRSKPEQISIKRPEPDQEKNPVPDSKDRINPNER